MARRVFRVIAFGLFAGLMLVSANFMFKSSAQAGRPVELDVRGAQGVPKGTALRTPSLAQVKALTALQSRVGDTVQVRYNGLTATPRHMFSYSAYLTAPSPAQPEVIARSFLSRNRELFRFSDEDLTSLRLKSLSTECRPRFRDTKALEERLGYSMTAEAQGYRLRQTRCV